MPETNKIGVQIYKALTIYQIVEGCCWDDVQYVSMPGNEITKKREKIKNFKQSHDFYFILPSASITQCKIHSTGE